MWILWATGRGMMQQLMETACSQHGYIIKYNGCPILWKLQLQLQLKVALCSTESEYMGLLYALCKAIQIDEDPERNEACLVFRVTPLNAKIHCQVFKDNSRTI